MIMKKLNKQLIKSCKLWKPHPEKDFEWRRQTNSWFDIIQMNKENSPNKKQLCVSSTIRALSVRLYPNHEQKKILLKWFEIYRQTYNNTLNYLTKTSNNEKNFIKLRKKIDIKLQQNNTFTKFYNKYKMPKHTRDNAIKDVLKAFKTAFSNLKNKNIKFFRIRRKKITSPKKTLVLEPGSFSKKKNGFAIKILGEMRSSIDLDREWLIKKECILCYNENTNIFNLIVPYDKKLCKILKKEEFCSLDPGIRTFQTVYTPNKNSYKICSDQTSHKVNKLISLINSPKGDPKQYASYIRRLRRKLKNRIDDLHWKTANFLCKNFQIIIIGNMSTKSICKKGGNLHSSSKKNCYNLSHYLFKQRLKSKCEEYECIYHEVDESYTSKTCGDCGELNNSLGSSKVFKCSKCNFICDRDVNGARNILYKYLQQKNIM